MLYYPPDALAIKSIYAKAIKSGALTALIPNKTPLPKPRHKPSCT